MKDGAGQPGVIKALLFDLGNVLVGFDFARGYRAIEEVCSIRAQDIQPLITRSNLVLPYERGEISSEDFFARISQMLNLQISYDQFCSLWSTIFLPQLVLPEELVIALRRRYRMVLVSNTNDIHYRMIEENYPVVQHFDARVLSYRVGAAKPSPAIYQEAVRQAQCRPEECFFTDDIPEFVEGARQYGIDAVQFQGREQLESELRKRGIEWDGSES
jgi:putative hydrolase of the HAD superfamily